MDAYASESNKVWREFDAGDLLFLILALVVFSDSREPNLYLIPASEWQNLNGLLKEVLAYREYKALKSPPEFGINLSARGIKAPGDFRVESSHERTFGGRASPETSAPFGP